MGSMDYIEHTAGCTSTTCRGECRVYAWPVCQASPAYVPAYLSERRTRAQRLARDREHMARRRRVSTDTPSVRAAARSRA